jgi:hypothetical protein
MSPQTIDVDPHLARESVTPVHDDDDKKVNATSPEGGNIVEKDTEEEASAGINYSHRDEPILPISTPQTPDVGTSSASRWDWEKVRTYLREDVDTDAATGPLSAFCFMTVSRICGKFDYLCVAR